MKILYTIFLSFLFLQIHCELIQKEQSLDLPPEHSDIMPNDNKFKTVKNQKIEKFYGRVLKITNTEMLVVLIPLLFFFVQLQMPIWMLGLFTFPLFMDYLKQMFQNKHEHQRKLNIHKSFILEDRNVQRKLLRQIKSYTEQQFEQEKKNIARYLSKEKIVLTDKGNNKKVIEITKNYLKSKNIKNRQIFQNLSKILRTMQNNKKILFDLTKNNQF